MLIPKSCLMKHSIKKMINQVGFLIDVCFFAMSFDLKLYILLSNLLKVQLS